MLAQIIYAGYNIGEITCPTRYMDDSSSINLTNSVVYGLGVLKTSLAFRFNKWGLISTAEFQAIKPKEVGIGNRTDRLREQQVP
jgi:hypothetical protein